MKLTQITAENFQGARSVNIVTDKPIIIVAGDNGAGKSSVRDAIAMLLGGVLTRVGAKKDSGALVTHGASAACIETCADGKLSTITITAAGKITDSQSGHSPDPAIAYLLDAQRFAKLPQDERRAFLFGLRNVKVSPTEISRRLTARMIVDGVVPAPDLKRIESITPLLRGGFDGAAKEAGRLATESKGAWKAIASEVYGVVKAATWKAPVPAFNSAALAQAQTRVTELSAAIGAKQQALGTQAEVVRAYQASVANLVALQDTFALQERRRAKLTADEAGLANAQRELDGAEALASGTAAPRVGMVHALARSLSNLLAAWPDELAPGDNEAVDAANACLEGYEDEHGTITPPVPGKATLSLESVAQYRNARDLMQRAAANARRDLDASIAAAAEVTRLSALPKPDDQGLSDMRTALSALQADSAAAAAIASEQSKLRDAERAAADRTAKAAQHHADVVGWLAIAEALSPDGIPAELLAEALGPVNDCLAQSAADSGWPLVVLDSDMRLTANDRPYALLSESEQWRCDAHFAGAVSALSGLRLLVLDRMDVLDARGRQELLVWLDVLAANGEVDTALVFGTLKAAPVGLPETMAAFWIGSGTCGEPLRELAEAA